MYGGPDSQILSVCWHVARFVPFLGRNFMNSVKNQQQSMMNLIISCTQIVNQGHLRLIWGPYGTLEVHLGVKNEFTFGRI